MVLTTIQSIILGIIQGITEWLPISSSGMIALTISNLYGITDLSFLVRYALFLHLGTFLAALIYFWKDVKKIILVAVKPRSSKLEERKIFRFLLIATIMSGIIGLIILGALSSFQGSFEATGKTISFAIGILLLVTGFLQLKTKSRGLRNSLNLKNNDGFILGIAQGLASLPGLSRSGITVSSLLLKKFNDTTALKLSFLMSLPIVLIGNIILNLNEFAISGTAIYGLIFAFLFGLITIHGLMKLSKRINFGWFVLILAILMIINAVV